MCVFILRIGWAGGWVPARLPPASHQKRWNRLDWVETYTGKKINLLSPDPYSIDIRDIAHGLSQVCRFSGKCCHFRYEAQNLMVCRDSWNRKYIQGKILLSPKNFDYTEPSIIESQFLNAFTSLTSPHIHIKKGGVSS